MQFFINNNNNNIIQFINEIDELEKNNIINDILELGFIYYKKKIKTNNDNELNEIINNNSLLKNINNNMNEITKNLNKSTKIGIFAENTIKQYLDKYYDSSQLIDTSNIPHSGDLHLSLEEVNTNIIIEIKNYSKNVDKMQINKLYNDMFSTGINYSIFISLYSGINGKKNDIEWEFFNNSNNNTNIVIYLSYLDKNIDNLQVAISLLTSFINLLNNSNVNNQKLILLENFTKNSYRKLSSDINDMALLKIHINKIKNSIHSLHDSVSKQILELYNTFSIFDNEYNSKFNLLKLNISKEFDNVLPNALNNDYNEIYNLLESFKSNKQIYNILQIIISDAIEYNYYFNIVSKLVIQLYNNNNINIAKINILKNSVNIVLSNNLQLKNIDKNNWLDVKHIIII